MRSSACCFALNPIHVKGKLDVIPVFSPVREKLAGEALSFIGKDIDDIDSSTASPLTGAMSAAVTGVPSIVNDLKSSSASGGVGMPATSTHSLMDTDCDDDRTNSPDVLRIEVDPIFGKIHLASCGKLMRGARAILEEFSTLHDEGALHHTYSLKSNASESRTDTNTKSLIKTNRHNLQGLLIVLEGAAGVGKTKVLHSWLRRLAPFLKKKVATSILFSPSMMLILPFRHSLHLEPLPI